MSGDTFGYQTGIGSSIYGQKLGVLLHTLQSREQPLTHTQQRIKWPQTWRELKLISSPAHFMATCGKVLGLRVLR